MKNQAGPPEAERPSWSLWDESREEPHRGRHIWRSQGPRSFVGFPPGRSLNFKKVLESWRPTRPGLNVHLLEDCVKGQTVSVPEFHVLCNIDWHSFMGIYAHSGDSWALKQAQASLAAVKTEKKKKQLFNLSSGALHQRQQATLVFVLHLYPRLIKVAGIFKRDIPHFTRWSN